MPPSAVSYTGSFPEVPTVYFIPPLLSMGFEENSPFVFFFGYIDQKMSLWGMAHEGEVYRDFWGSFRRHGQEKKRFVASYFFCFLCRGARGRPRHPLFDSPAGAVGKGVEFLCRREPVIDRAVMLRLTCRPRLPAGRPIPVILFKVLGSRAFFQEGPAGVRGRAPRNMRQGQSPS